jgi:ATP-dependent DNA ligase
MQAEIVQDPREIPADYLLTPLTEGWRVIVVCDDRIRIRSRSGGDLAPALPEIVAALARGRRSPASAATTAVDATLCWPRRTDGVWPTLGAIDSVVLLDLLVAGGRDVTGRDVRGRVEQLRALFATEGPISVAPLWRGAAADAWAQARHASVAKPEGLLARRASSPYRPGRRTRDWLELELEHGEELLVCGITESGAVVLGAPTPRGLAFAGVTWPTRRWAELAARCEEGPRPFPDPHVWPSLGPVAWARPSLWVRVAPDRRAASGTGGPAWRLEHVLEDLVCAVDLPTAPSDPIGELR